MQKISKYAFFLLSKKDYTVYELTQKLTLKFGENKNIDNLINYLKKENYLNDNKFIKNFIRYETKYLLNGKFKIYQKLLKKGINKDLFFEIWNEENIDEEKIKEKLLEINKYKWVNLKNETQKKAKIYRYLKQKGF
jgi:regulatory protein